MGHALADEISQYFGEPDKYPMYLQFVKRLGHEKVRFAFEETKRAESGEKKKLFMWKVSKKAEGFTK